VKIPNLPTTTEVRPGDKLFSPPTINQDLTRGGRPRCFMGSTQMGRWVSHGILSTTTKLNKEDMYEVRQQNVV
jgi:hypothetical protein